MISRWFVCCLLLVFGCSHLNAATLTTAPFGRSTGDVPVSRYVMTTTGGVSVTFMNYGGAITDVVTPDRDGSPGHIVLGFPTLREYETVDAIGELYFGALLGRYANWLKDGRFNLLDRAYQITLSDPPNTIHGGKTGFDRRIWAVQPLNTSGSRVSALLTYISPDGEEGFPGTLRVSVTYTLDDDGAFTIRYRATTDRPTVVNLSSHMNFNLAGAGSPDSVLKQVLAIRASRFLPLDRSQIPLGTPASVAGTPFDFRRPTPIGDHIHDRNDQIAIAGGYDQYWILEKTADDAIPQLAARVLDPSSGRTLECDTSEPGLQIYTADWFDGSIVGIGGRYGKYAAFTLETQHYPDSPNHPDFPSTVLRPGQTFDSTTTFRFAVQR